MNRLSRAKRAFTLIEMLVAIAVIAILAILAFPLTSGALEKSHYVQCASNLRQIGIGLNLYLNDHEQRMPVVNDNRFDQALESYIRERAVFLCPSDPNHSHRKDGSYRWNRALNDQLTTNLKLSLGNSVIEDKHDIIVLCDKESWHHHQPELREYNRQGRFNFLYADGSVGNHPLTLPN